MEGGSKSILLIDEHSDTLADCLHNMLVLICNGDWAAVVVGCENGAFRLSSPRNYGSARPCFGRQYISLTILALQYLARMFHVVQQQLNDYALALSDVLSYVALSFTSLTYVEQVPNASEHIDYRHLFEEFVTVV